MNSNFIFYINIFYREISSSLVIYIHERDMKNKILQRVEPITSISKLNTTGMLTDLATEKDEFCYLKNQSIYINGY